MALFLATGLLILGLKFLSSPNATIAPASAAYFSAGERVLFVDAATPVRRAANQISDGDYQQAVAELETFLSLNPNDPEARVYLNNARIAQQPHYMIAVALPVADRPFGQAKEILRGVAQAQTEINQQGGINGIPLKVLIAKDEDRLEVAQQAATKLVSLPEVLGVIGHFSSDASVAAGQIYQQADLVMISPTSTATKLTDLGNYIFRTVPDDRRAAEALAGYMTTALHKRKAAVYYCSNSIYSQSLKREFARALRTQQGNIVATFDLTNREFDALATIEESQRQQAEVIVLFHNTKTRPQALEVVGRNDRTLPILGGDSTYDLATLKLGEPAVGVVVAVPWVFRLQDAFAVKARAFWRADINWRTVTAYDATQALIAGLQQNPTRQGIQQALSNPNFVIPGAVAPIRFTNSGDLAQPTNLAIVQADPGSKSGYLFQRIE